MPLPSHIYDRDYFLSDKCEGYGSFLEGHGLSPIKAAQVRALDPAPGVRILDAGCGRGEVLLACAEAGAEVAGLDYSEAAVTITGEVLAGVQGADVRHGDVARLPWPNESFNRILFADVIEHLDAAATTGALREFHRVLQPGGTLLVHTAPNRTFLNVTWPLARIALRLMGRGDSARLLNGWIAESKKYHLNEQTLYSLRRAVRAAGFDQPRVWIDPNVLRGGQHHLTDGLEQSSVLGIVERLARLRPVRLFLGNDLYAAASKGQATRTG